MTDVVVRIHNIDTPAGIITHTMYACDDQDCKRIHWTEPAGERVHPVTTGPHQKEAAMPNVPELKAGIYRHYKGPLYEVSGYAHDANDSSRLAVLYRGLELDGAKLGPRWSVRTAEMQEGMPPDDYFFDLVCGRRGCGNFGELSTFELCPTDHYVPRFAYLGPVLEAWMLDREEAT